MVPPIMLGSSDEVNPAWVRKCADNFKKDKCLLTHELRTLENWKRFNVRVESSIYKQIIRTICPACDVTRRSRRPKGKDAPLKCTCSKNLTSKLPFVAGMRDIPSELLEPEEASAPADAARKRKAGAAGRRQKRDSGLYELDGGAAALLGEDGLDPMKLSSEDIKQEEKEDGAEKEGEKERAVGSDGEEIDDEEDDEDLEGADYAVGKTYDDDEDLVDDEGGGSDDEEARYGTF